MGWDEFLPVLIAGVTPVLPQFALIAAVVAVIGAPLPGRGPRLFQRQDPWRRFKYGSRDIVMSRAGHRCEGAVFLAWGRCTEAATDVDHVYPHVRGGPTVPSNGQALCRGHNKAQGCHEASLVVCAVAGEPTPVVLPRGNRCAGVRHDVRLGDTSAGSGP